eukprot:435799-Prorocentrum_minimum.AAC.1
MEAPARLQTFVEPRPPHPPSHRVPRAQTSRTRKAHLTTTVSLDSAHLLALEGDKAGGPKVWEGGSKGKQILHGGAAEGGRRLARLSHSKSVSAGSSVWGEEGSQRGGKRFQAQLKHSAATKLQQAWRRRAPGGGGADSKNTAATKLQRAWRVRL